MQLVHAPLIPMIELLYREARGLVCGDDATSLRSRPAKSSSIGRQRDDIGGRLGRGGPPPRCPPPAPNRLYTPLVEWLPCTFVSLVASCELDQLDPEAYLRNLVRVLAVSNNRLLRRRMHS